MESSKEMWNGRVQSVEPGFLKKKLQRFQIRRFRIERNNLDLMNLVKSLKSYGEHRP